MNKHVGSAADAVEAARVVRFAQTVIRIPSQRWHESQLAEYLGAYLFGLGFEVTFHPLSRGDRSTKQVVARWRGVSSGPTIMLHAHMDTGSGQYEGLVFKPDRWTKDPLGGEVKNGWLYGLGSQNNKNGVVACTMAAEALVRSRVPFRGTLLLAFVVLETAGGIGTAELLRDGVTADAAIVTEGTGQDIVTVSAGNIRGVITFRGGYSHHHRFVDPKDFGYRVLSAFGAAYEPVEPGGWLTFSPHPTLPGFPRVAIRKLEADLESCSLYFDIITVPSMTPVTVESDLRKLLKQISTNGDVTAELDMTRWISPYIENQIYGAADEPADSRLVRSLTAGHESVMGVPPVIGMGNREGAAADSTILRRHGISTVEYGPGSVKDLQAWPAIDERIRTSDLVNCSKVLAESLARLSSSASG